MYIVLASGNKGKLQELQSLLPPWVEVRSAAECGVELPEETGSTFAENAVLKARAAAAQTGCLAVADDSGLEVDALGGEPGVRSSRFAGEPSDDEANNGLLLVRLAGIPEERRTARFRSVVAVVAPDGQEFVADGVIEGIVTDRARGDAGFGYDPLFQPIGATRTMAEMSLDEKNSISHRGKAFRQAAERLIPMLEGYQSEPGSPPVHQAARNAGTEFR